VGRIHDTALVRLVPSLSFGREDRQGIPTKGRNGVMPLALGAAVALPIALWRTSFHAVPTTSGLWRGVSDPPSLLGIAVGVVTGAAWAFFSRARLGAQALWLLLAAAPLVPLLSGHFVFLLAFQGRVILLLSAAVLAASIAGTDLPERLGLFLRGGFESAAVLFVLGFSFYAWLGTHLPGPAGPQGDEPHYLMMAESLLRDKDLDLTNQFQNRDYAGFYTGRLEPHTSPASPPGRMYPVHTPGLPILLLPGYALGGYPGARLWMSALAALTGCVVYQLVRSVFSQPVWALASWAAIVFTPPFPFYAVALYPETPAALATALFLLAATRRVRPWLVLLVSLLSALLPWLHPKFLLLSALGLGALLLRGVSTSLRMVSLFILSASVGGLLYFFHALYGHASLAAAYGPGFGADVSLRHIPSGALALLFDRQFGLLPVGPLWAFALPGAVSLIRLRAWEGVWAGLLAAAVVGVGAAFSMWWGGSCPPARFLIPALPALALALPLALRGRRFVSAALWGIGAGIVALAADIPRALHNRADGQSALLRVLTPSLNLEDFLPSFISGPGVLLSITLAAALALAWVKGRKGLLACLPYFGLCAALGPRPLLSGQGSSLSALDVWPELSGWHGGLDLSTVSVPFELPDAPWRLEEFEIRNSRRLELPPGLYRLEIRASLTSALRWAHVARLDLVAGELPLLRTYLVEGEPIPSPELLLPVGARRLILTAAGIQAQAVVEAVTLRPRALVPRRQRGDFPWPRSPEEDRYRVGKVPVTALDASAPRAGGFRLEDEDGAFLVELPKEGQLTVQIKRPQPSPADVFVWGGTRMPLGEGGETVLTLAGMGGVVLGDIRVVPAKLHARQGFLLFEPAS